MRTLMRWLVVGGVAVAASVAAGPRKVLVLPIDGDTDAALRIKLNVSLHKLAHSIEGDVAMGDTTFAETAAAVGCDPKQPSCAGTVLTTLSVDELVWGTATTTNGQTTIVVRRATKGAPTREQSTTLSATDAPDKAESGLQPLFGPAPPIVADAGSGSAGSGSAGSGSAGSGSDLVGSAGPGQSFFDTRERKLGVGFAAGGGLALVIGFVLWANETSYQGQIDSHPTATLADITALKKLEDTAGRYASWGNAMVLIGIAAGGVGSYFLWKDHKNRAVTVTPSPAETGSGMTLVLGGRW